MPHQSTVTSILKGLRRSAQGCEARATLGTSPPERSINPEGVVSIFVGAGPDQGRRQHATPSG